MTGAERAQQQQPESGFEQYEAVDGPDWIGPAPEAPASGEQPGEDRSAPPLPLRVRLLGAALLAAALAWIGAFGFALWRARPALTLDNGVSWIASLSGPLILLALLWLWLGRTPRREAERFTRAIEDMRTESNALETVLGIIAARIEENHTRLRGEAERLMSLGDEASDRLGRVTHYLAKETATLDRKAAALDSAAAAARVDIGVLLHDLPKAEEQARAVAEAMKEAGLQAHGQAGALEAQLSALAARGREADETLGGAAQRLAAHVARIESGSAAAAASMGEASADMNAAVDAAMARAAEAVDAARAGLDTQMTGMMAAIEQGRSTMDKAGEDAARSLSHRLDTIGGKLQALAGHLAAQDAASHALVTGLGKELAELDQWFAQLGQTGSAEAQRLAASVAEVRESTQALIGELAGGSEQAGLLAARGEEMNRILGGVEERLAGPVTASLAGVEGQAERTAGALAALVPLVESVEASSRGIDARIGEVRRQAESLAALLSGHDQASSETVARLAAELDGLEQRFAAVGAAGTEQAERLAGGIATLRGAAEALEAGLGGGAAQAGELGARADALGAALRQIAARLEEELPEALARVEAQADRSGTALAALEPAARGIEETVGAAAGRIGEAEASIARQREALESLLARVEEGTGGAEQSLAALGRAAAEAQQAAARIVAETAPELVEAMVRVRETANQAAERAREAISSVIPSSAAALGEAGREALSEAIAGTFERQMAELSAVSERALRTARSASERLTRQMLTIGETAAAIETRIDEARKERDAKESEGFSRRVALLIESLNSTAIDVTKIMSNEVTDSAWAAYLKGDRGVFTRRAVRLLDATEAREIARHYEEEPEFREQVNRYIHDFEAMLRRILADRDGSPLGVTILSSDMGKLYVALAQAIDRLRK